VDEPQPEHTEAEAVVLRFFQAMNSGDLDEIAALSDASIRFVDVAAQEEVKGRDAFRGYCARYVKAFPDLQLEVTNLVSAGNTATVEGVCRGTHKAALESPAGSIPATQRTIEVPFCMVARAADGLLADAREYYDAVTLMLQLGIMPEPVSAGG
jgi:steroid delta-isomerase-like uncharacterized protein